MFHVDELLRGRPPRTNLNLHHVDGAFTLRVARLRDAFPWHHHVDAEEAWVVLHGRIRFRTDRGTVEGASGDVVVIPAHVRHSPLALEDDTTVLVMHRRGMPLVYDDPDMSDATAGYSEHELSEIQQGPSAR